MPSIQLSGGVVVKDEPITENKVATRSTAAASEGSQSITSSRTTLEQTNRGSNKSGRPWKAVKKEKASMAVYRPMKKTLGSTWEGRQAEKQKLKEAKELQDELLEKKRAKFEEEKQRNADKRKRKAENELKSAKIQVMSRPEKIKKMSKKQLKSVYKTRMGDDGVVRLVGAYE